MQEVSAHRKIRLQATELSVGYRQNNREKVILSDLNLQLFSGQLTALLGPNGSGKSTLIRSLCNLQKQLKGEIIINGIPTLNTISKSIAIVLTSAVYAPSFTVYEMVSSGRFPYTNWLGKLSANDHEIVKQAIDMVGIGKMKNQLVHQLSDGEKQRMMIAKALAQQCPIIILDEPTAHLDLINRVEITKLLRQLAHNEDKAILMATHELDLAIQTADKLWLVEEGKLISGAPEDLIIKGDLQNTFAKLSIQFNHNSGGFKVIPQLTKSIVFRNKNNTIEEIWTEKLMEKLGYEIVEDNLVNTKLYFSTKEHKWLLYIDNQEYTFNTLGSISDFLTMLEE